MKNYQKGFIVPFLLTLFVIVLTGSVYYFYSKNNTKQQLNINPTVSAIQKKNQDDAKLTIDNKEYSVTDSVGAQKIYGIAIEKKDITICDKVNFSGLGDTSTSDLQLGCYLKYAAAYPDQEICSSILEKNWNVPFGPPKADFSLCVATRASAAKDSRICSQLSDANEKNNCVKDITK